MANFVRASKHKPVEVPDTNPEGVEIRQGVCGPNTILSRMSLPLDDSKRLIVTPHFPCSIEASSLDVHLGHWFKVPRRSRLRSINLANKEEFARVASTSQEEVFIYKENRLIMHPGDLVLGTTLEFVALPGDIMAFVEGKSQLGRRGLIVATATQVAPGFHGVVVLELVNAGMIPLELEPGMPVAQMIFQTLTEMAPNEKLYRKSSYCQIRP